MKKIFLLSVLFLLIFFIFVPKISLAWSIGDPIAPNCPTCTTSGDTTTCTNPCTICDFFQMLVNVYQFIILEIATPLAIVAITVGGIMLLISAGSPNLAGLGKKILYAAIIGLALVFCSWLIIDFVLTTLGMTSGSWASLNLSCSGS